MEGSLDGDAPLSEESYDRAAKFCGVDTRALNQSDASAFAPARPDDETDDPSGQSPGTLAVAVSKGGRGGRGDPPAAELDPGEGMNRDGTIRNKSGDHGRFRGRDGKRADDAGLDEVCDELNLDKDQRRRLHQAIGGRNLDTDGIREEAEAMFPERRPKGQSEPEQAPQPEQPPDPPSPDASVLKKVAEVVVVLGLSIGLVATTAAALADPEPASKLALAGLTVVEVSALAVALGFKAPANVPDA